MIDHDNLAEALYNAEKQRKQIDPLTLSHPGMSVNDAYEIQRKIIDRRLLDGERIIGMKVGLTSLAMQRLLGVDTPDFGHLTDRMLLLEGQPCNANELLQPKVEGELAFCIGKILKGPGVTIADVYLAVEWVVPAIEIVDSRIRDWKIKLSDTISDNGSSARLVLGSRMTSISKIDMRLIGMTLEKNGILASSGAGAAVMGNPAASVAWLINTLSEFDIGVKPGDIIMSGAVTAAENAVKGDVFTVSFQNMGSVSLRFA